jgi:hypothetical protein
MNFKMERELEVGPIDKVVEEVKWNNFHVRRFLSAVQNLGEIRVSKSGAF